MSRKCTGVLLAAGLVFSGASDQSALAKKPKGQAQSDAQLVQAMQVLRATKQTLQAANHDYGGHRVAAIRAVGAAHHQLKLALEHGQKSKRKPNRPGIRPKNPAGQPEPQDVSNLQLAESIVVLNATTQYLASAKHDYGGHRGNAIRDLNLAIDQLNLALKFDQNRRNK
jgi:hypothetical protein